MFLIITYIIHAFENLSTRLSLLLDLLDVWYIIILTNTNIKMNTKNKMDNQKETIGKIVKNARLKQGLSQGEVARKASIQQSYLSQIESDKGRPPTVYVIEKVAFTLKLDTKKLIKLLEIERFKYEERRLNRKKNELGLRTIDKHFHSIPILSQIPSSIPDNHQDFPPELIEDFYSLSVEKGSFLYRIKEDSMSPRIKERDLVLISTDEKAKNGDIAVIRNGRGDCLLRRVTFEPDQIILTAENAEYPVLVWRTKDEPKIMGLVKLIIKREFIKREGH